MSTRHDDGGPAFPRPGSIDPRQGDLIDGNDYVAEQEGMTLRDWFAGQALVGILAFSPLHVTDQLSSGVAADDAYAIANEMLRARKAPRLCECEKGGA